MMYMTPQSSVLADLGPQWGQIVTPQRWANEIGDGRFWCMDNGIFTGKFNADEFISKMKILKPFISTCLFVVAPDVVGDAYSTMCRFPYWSRKIKELDYPVALVAQDDFEYFPFPKAHFDTLFIGGSTEWKMSSAALHCIHRAKKAGKWVHVGRVNSQKRMAHFQIAGVDSVDGTTVCFAPDKNYLVIEKQLQKRALPFWRYR